MVYMNLVRVLDTSIADDARILSVIRRMGFQPPPS
jgi:hypothetical protein